MRYIMFLAGALPVLWSTGCNAPSSPQLPVNIEVRLMASDSVTAVASVTVALTSLPQVDMGGEKAVLLSTIVPVSLVNEYIDKNNNAWDTRMLYAYRLIGSDGFSPDNLVDTLTGRAYENLNWELMGNGYIKIASRNAAFNATVNLPGRYKVRDVAVIEVYRKVDVIYGNDTARIELVNLADTVFNGSTAVWLPAILSMVASPETRLYSVSAVDGFTGTSPYDWTLIRKGYWLIDSDKLDFEPDSGITTKSKISYVREIKVQ